MRRLPQCRTCIAGIGRVSVPRGRATPAPTEYPKARAPRCPDSLPGCGGTGVSPPADEHRHAQTRAEPLPLAGLTPRRQPRRLRVSRRNHPDLGPGSAGQLTVAGVYADRAEAVTWSPDGTRGWPPHRRDDTVRVRDATISPAALAEKARARVTRSLSSSERRGLMLPPEPATTRPAGP